MAINSSTAFQVSISSNTAISNRTYNLSRSISTEANLRDSSSNNSSSMEEEDGIIAATMEMLRRAEMLRAREASTGGIRSEL